MFNSRSGERAALNWRGPLLAAGVFLVLFALLLLMARQNESNTSEMGSSVREDPYGASLLFDSYARAGYQVKRSQEEDSLPDEDASTTTAFFIGGHDWRMQGGSSPKAEKLAKQMEDFLARGGRVVVIAPPWRLKSESQGWQVENEWSKEPLDPHPHWLTPVHGAVADGSEALFIQSDAPWLKTDAAWSVLYSGQVETKTKDQSGLHVYMARRAVKNGELIAVSQESFLLNETIKTNPSPVLLDFLVNGRRNVWVDETLHGFKQRQGVLWLVQRYRLQPALFLFWATLLVLLWSMSGDLVRRPMRDRGAPVLHSTERAGVAACRLLQRSVVKEQVVAEVWEEFRRRSPQDAEAIATSPQSRESLRKALTQSPLAGYQQLRQLVLARRKIAKGLARAGRDTQDSTASAKKDSEEVRFA